MEGGRCFLQGNRVAMRCCDFHPGRRIPSQAGMAGGSADAAAVLTGLNALYQAGLSLEQLQQIGVKVGADVPYCLVGGTARVTGIGEKVVPCPR